VCPQDLGQMSCVLADECGAVPRSFVSDPASTGHGVNREWKSVVENSVFYSLFSIH